MWLNRQPILATAYIDWQLKNTEEEKQTGGYQQTLQSYFPAAKAALAKQVRGRPGSVN